MAKKQKKFKYRVALTLTMSKESSAKDAARWVRDALLQRALREGWGSSLLKVEARGEKS